MPSETNHRLRVRTAALFTNAAAVFCRGVVTARWFIVVGWVALTVLLSVFGPDRGSGNSGGVAIAGLLPAHSVAGEIQARSLAEFRVPVLSETTVVVHDPHGLSALTRADVALWALSFAQATQRASVPAGPGQIIAAIPIPTATANTAATYLYMSANTSLEQTTALANQYAAHFHNQTQIQTYVTGLAPAQLRQGYYLTSWLPLLEVATLALIAVAVAIAFRSLVAPVAVLLVAGLGYLAAVKLLGLGASLLGFALPDELQPLIAALLLGVVTDYCVLMFFGFRRQLRRYPARHDAAARAFAADGPIVAVAGMTVAAGTAALLAANYPLFRAFGPVLSITVLVGLAVSLTLAPALMAILGDLLFWPRRAEASTDAGRHRVAGPGRLLRVVADRRGAAVATTLVVASLLLAAAPLSQLRLDLSFTSGLPLRDPVQRGATVLDGSGIRGVTAPLEVLVEGKGVAAQRDELKQFQALLGTQPGVAAVLGPAQNPLPDNYGIVFSADGDAARVIVIFDSDPLGGDAIADLRLLSTRVSALASEARVHNASVSITGQTAIASELGYITRQNLWLTLLVALAVELLILMLYLRTIIAPIVLLICSVLGVAAALGLSIVVFQGLRGDPGLTFYEPFAAAVLLLALGSDYNVFAVGSIWEQAARRPLKEAIMLAMPGTSRAITTAGLILASTFAMVAIIPLETFRQLAFTMAAGLIIDTFLVRPVVTPAVLILLGRFANWPGQRLRTGLVNVAELPSEAVIPAH